MPSGWIVGWNRQGDISNKTLYEIRATPTVYLLDKQKKVILKDASIEQIIQYLQKIRLCVYHPAEKAGFSLWHLIRIKRSNTNIR